MKIIIAEWTASKNTNDFNYSEALKTLINERTIINQSIDEYLHFDFSNQAILEKFEVVTNINKENISRALDLINTYTYYLEMNEHLKVYEDKNIKRLKKFNDILDDEFIDFLDRYLYLDKTILLSANSLKVVDNYEDGIAYYLKKDFKLAIEKLNTFFQRNKIAKNEHSIKESNYLIPVCLKPKTRAYLKPLSKRAILKCLYFDLLYNFKGITKDDALDLLNEFFDEKLQSTKVEHTLTTEDIKHIKDGNIYNTKFDAKIENANISEYQETVSKHLIELLNTKEALEDNFNPYLTITSNNSLQ